MRKLIAIIQEFNRKKFAGEDVAIEFFTLRSWNLASYSGNSGITFHKVAEPNVTIWRDSEGFWVANSATDTFGA